MNNGLILWADDEIELLKAHIIFLEKKNYEVVTVSNGMDALDQCTQRNFNLIMLDEMMPGLSGLETLQRIKEIQPATPVVMCTKSEEENIMEQVIGSKITDLIYYSSVCHLLSKKQASLCCFFYDTFLMMLNIKDELRRRSSDGKHFIYFFLIDKYPFC